ncbi:T9SS type A sorting domain-containing protein [Psychroserpens sp.]|uniref:T9SS type A sorting domain-containing protein n=1 Tax=Psychroserpens sp. TaxID=2020870 RepID=UPI002B27B5F7|nr:T9SS type A sorting domain-containing protein [Psychroserpens sp.]
MKQKLLFTFLLSSFISFAQAPIAEFVNSMETDYALIDSTVLLDESASGTAVTWNFTSLSQVGTNTDTNVAPTSGELSTYPGTTEVLVVTTNSMPPAESRLFIRDVANEISITGAAQEGLELNLTNNATLGTFPLSFGDSNTDTVSGTFAGSVDGTNVSGTFTGSFDADVDAYGALNLNDFGLGAYNGNVTRIKTVLDITLVVAGIFNIGTVVQTGYYYFDDSDGSLVFRSSTNVFDIDFLGNIFMDTVALYEAQDRSTLGLNEIALASNDVKLFPNPTRTILNVKSSNSNTFKSIQVLDLNGRTVLNIKDNYNTIDVSNLQLGLYILNIETTNGYISKRFIKK